MPTKLEGLSYGRATGPYYHGLIAEPDCSNCPLQGETMVLPDGPVPARLAFIGEEPGQKEKMMGRGFIGPSGALLWHMADKVGIKREDVWVSNASLCSARPMRLDSGAVIPKLVVKSAAAQACRNRLLQELLVVDPVVIMPLGNWALWALSDIQKAKIFAYRGARIDVDLARLADLVARGLCRAPSKQVKT